MLEILEAIGTKLQVEVNLKILGFIRCQDLFTAIVDFKIFSVHNLLDVIFFHNSKRKKHVFEEHLSHKYFFSF